MRDLMVRYPHGSVIVLILVTLFGYVGGVRYYADEAKRQAAFDQAGTFLDSIIGFHKYYSKDIVPRIEASGGRFSLEFAENPKTFPFPASVSIEFGNALRSVNPSLDTKLYSNFPFPSRSGRKLDDFETESLAVLLKNPEREFAKFETRDGVETIRYARAMVMGPDCVACHSLPEFGFQGKWKVGDIRGARQVTLPVVDIAPIIDAATIAALAIAVVASVLGGLLVLPVVGQLRRSMVESRTLALEKIDLAEALDNQNVALRAAIDAKRRFLTGISHDLRTPLTAIIGFSELLSAGSRNPKVHQDQAAYAGFIHESGLHLHETIEQILELSALEEGTWKPRDKVIDLAELVESIRPTFQASLGDVEMELRLVGLETLSWLVADESAVRRLLTNLVDNAAKYSGGTTVEIEGRSNADGGISLTVSDNGRGIGGEEQEELSQFGARADEKREDSDKSLGIGLWLVDMLMAAHDGKVGFGKPSLDSGLKVTLDFPAYRAISVAEPEGGA
jgi:signal transduction histidine kinase